jgi:Arc/MetJ-type ribon-helix-helix transcriptional regulator
MNARDPISLKVSPSSSPNSRGQAAIVHVDLGADLKSAVCAAAHHAGVRPSEWMRSQLAQAVSAAEPRPADRPGSGPRHRCTPEASGQIVAPKAHQLSLQSNDLAWLDQIAQAGGFRSRPAALRFALRALASAEGLAALKQLPAAIPALVQSNMSLQAAVRARQLLPETHEPSRQIGFDSATLRREIAEHLEKVSRLVAALQPLLATPGTTKDPRTSKEEGAV